MTDLDMAREHARSILDKDAACSPYAPCRDCRNYHAGKSYAYHAGALRVALEYLLNASRDCDDPATRALDPAEPWQHDLARHLGHGSYVTAAEITWFEDHGEAACFCDSMEEHYGDQVRGAIVDLGGDQ